MFPGDISSSGKFASTASYNGLDFTVGPAMPLGAERHCMARLNPDQVVLTGGNPNKTRLWIMDSSTMEVQETFILPQNRVTHACGMAKNPVSGKVYPKVV